LVRAKTALLIRIFLNTSPNINEVDKTINIPNRRVKRDFINKFLSPFTRLNYIPGIGPYIIAIIIAATTTPELSASNPKTVIDAAKKFIRIYVVLHLL